MKGPKQLFHLISYLQYPLYAGAIVFYVPFVRSLMDKAPNWTMLNYVLILFGVAISFSTLQDTTKTQNKVSRKVWESPVKGKIALGFIALLAFSFVGVGLALLYVSRSDTTESIAVGITVLGIGLVGVLKSALEMFENHRKDKILV
ncbi:MAG: hypothetical protein KDC79_15465 [Cyclobacteriaceae bacterium]|nr:hypothetical protein [Cyclobacteriaceae bacterium]